MMAKRKPFKAAKTHFFASRYFSVSIIVCAGVVSTVIAFLSARYWQTTRLNTQLQKQVDEVVRSLQKNTDSNFEPLLAVNDFYSASTAEVSRQEFSDLAKRLLLRHPSIELLAWTPRIPNPARQAFETAIRNEGYKNYQIYEQQTQGTMVRSSVRSEYFPISYIEPFNQYELAFGFDLGSEEKRRSTLEIARDRGTLATTGRLGFSNNKAGFLLVMPVYQNNQSLNTLEARRTNLKGFAVGLFLFPNFIKSVLGNVDAKNINLVFYDETVGSQERFLAFYDSESGKVLTESDQEITTSSYREWLCQKDTCLRQFKVGNRLWSVEFLPTEQYFGESTLWLSWVFLVGGLSLTASLAVYALRYEQHSRRIEQLVKELSQANFEIRSLSRISDALQACLSLEEAYSVIPRLVQKLFPLHSGIIYTISASGNIVEAATTWGNNLASQLVFSPNDCWGIRCGRPHLFENTYSGLACSHFTQPLAEECYCVPMMAQGETLGLFYLQAPERGKFTEAKQQLALTVAEHIALALANLRLRETLKNQSIRDPLTGLFNRRYLEESLERELLRAERQKHSVGVIMIDIDHFKKLNDTYGHEAGDIVLQELAVFLQGSIRASDIACRYGGEEFTLILPEATMEVTKQRAEQLREGAKHLHVHYRRQPIGRITLSLGVASFPAQASSASAVLRAADEALYKAKSAGRDRVQIAS
ncbi:diguanylate cyclase [Ancylothrix sp. C2]|uniref:diguanylate cyclase n=1 Tax=Ancylothrix sp. D3o TaxID=2953691 RepID=UPI0021BAF85F|nr:diguanylate cyclase [Ancylothrix sp. D3o]MCT7951513.1 diguanylate cyclase [Ancylothrix sp. D3o]